MKRFLIFLFALNISASDDWSHKNSCSINSYDKELIKSLVKNMTLEQKVGQIIMPDIDEVTPAEAKKYQLGTFLNGGGKFPNKNKNSSIDDWKNLSKAFYDASPKVNGIKIPILWGTDAVHGHNNVIGATIFPHNIGLGASMNPGLVKEIGEAVAKELLSTGISWTFAPTIAVPRDDRWGRTYEGYSENPNLVAELGQAMILGLQGIDENYLDNNHVLSTAKHFIGDGGTSEGIDQGNTQISEKELRDVHGLPYYFAIDSCIQVIMASFNSWNGKKLHGYEYLLKDVLKNQMNFDGLIVGDWNGHGQLPNCTNSNCAQSFNAGVDIFMAPDEWKALYINTLKQVKNGEISSERLDDAIYRILRVKAILGLFDEKKPHMFPKNFVGNDDHKKLARKAVRQSIVLLKNNDSVLPLNPKKHYLVVGKSAIDIKNQMGGWTISWQGRDNLNNEFPGTKNIFTAIKTHIEKDGGTVEYSSDGSYKQKPDAAIMVYGEEPYAEGDGDLKSIIFNNPDTNYYSVMKKISNQNIDIISLFISGRPLVINRELNISKAFVELWLPGSAVEGISDIIFSTEQGEVKYDFHGKLPYSWPRNSAQTSINMDDEDYDPLFAYGYGLSYKDTVNLPNYAEEKPFIQLDKIMFFAGSALPPNNEFIIEDKKYSKVNADFYKSPNSKVLLQKIDYQKQDDAKNIKFYSTSNINEWGIENQYLYDLSYTSNAIFELVFRKNKFESKDDKVFISFKCTKNDYDIHVTGNDKCSATFDITDILKESKNKDWKTLKIPFKCLTEKDFDLSSISSVFSIKTSASLDIDIHSLKMINMYENEKNIKCDSL